jgi:proliferating cell nuclear antigen
MCVDYTQTPNTMLEFSLKNAVLFKTTFSNFSNGVVDCVLKFNYLGMTMQAMDSSHVSMVSIKFVATEMFDDYKCSETTNIALSIKNLLTVMKLSTKDSVVKFVQKNPTDDRLTIGITSKDKKTNFLFDLNLMDIECEELDLPDHVTGWKLNVNFTDIANVTNNMGEFGDVVSLCFGISTKDELLYQMEGGTGVVTGAIQLNSSEWTGGGTTPLETITLKLSMRLLKNYLTSRDISDTVELVMGQDIPFCMSYSTGEQSTVTFYIAPKIEEEG